MSQTPPPPYLDPPVLLIDDGAMRTYATLPVGVTTDTVAPYIRQAQSLVVRNHLGRQLYHQLASAWFHNNMTPELHALMEYVRPVLVPATMSLWLRASGTALGAYGQTGKGGAATTATAQTDGVAADQADQFRAMAGDAAGELLYYLETNAADYPAWSKPSDPDPGPSAILSSQP